MKASSKRAALRSLERVLVDVRERIAFRTKYKPEPGSVLGKRAQLVIERSEAGMVTP